MHETYLRYTFLQTLLTVNIFSSKRPYIIILICANSYRLPVSITHFLKCESFVHFKQDFFASWDVACEQQIISSKHIQRATLVNISARHIVNCASLLRFNQYTGISVCMVSCFFVNNHMGLFVILQICVNVLVLQGAPLSIGIYDNSIQCITISFRRSNMWHQSNCLKTKLHID